MDVLRLLWTASWLLAAFALTWMALLVLARLFRDRAARRRQMIHQAVIDAYLRLMRDDMRGFDDLLPHRREGRILAEALLDLLDIVRGSQRQALIEGLIAFGLDKTLRARARRGPAAARLAALEALACFPGPETEKVVRQAGRSTGGPVRMAATKSLLAMDAHVDLDLLIEDMRRRKEAWSGPMADILTLLAARQPQDCVRELKRPDLPESLRAMIAEGLGGATDYRVVPALSEAAMGAPPKVRAASLRALGRLMHPAVEPVVARGIADQDWQVRGAAAAAAGSAGLTALVPLLAEHLADPVWWVRFQAAEALTRLGPDGLTTLRKIAHAGPDAAARAASLTLAERGLQ